MAGLRETSERSTQWNLISPLIHTMQPNVLQICTIHPNRRRCVCGQIDKGFQNFLCFVKLQPLAVWHPLRSRWFRAGGTWSCLLSACSLISSILNWQLFFEITHHLFGLRKTEPPASARAELQVGTSPNLRVSTVIADVASGASDRDT